MAGFIRRTLIFAVMLTGVFSVNAIINLHIFRNASLPFDRPSVLIIGDSHLAKALDADQLVSAVNIAQAFEPYHLMFWKLAYVLERMSPDTVIIGFTHHNLSTFNDIKFSDERYAGEMMKRSYIIGRFGEEFGLKFDHALLIRQRFRRLCLFPQKHLDVFITRFNNDAHSDVSSPVNPIKRHFGSSENAYQVSTICRAYLDSMVNLCHHKGVVPVLVGSPVHHSYLAAIPGTFVAGYEQTTSEMEQSGVRVIDMTGHLLPDSCFLDADHLNIHGASAFQTMLWSELNASAR